MVALYGLTCAPDDIQTTGKRARDDAVATLRLGVVERSVRRRDKAVLLRPQDPPGCGRYADARCHPAEFALGMPDILRAKVAREFLGDHNRTMLICFRKQNYELFATISGDDICRPFHRSKQHPLMRRKH